MQEALRIDAIWCAHMIVLVPDQQIRMQEALRIDSCHLVSICDSAGDRSANTYKEIILDAILV